ncbi:MAG: SGNH/GDSL hydrolase family protein [Clostridia bacterium]|nr:SGNH/GDSL hydrolase family protein [Clostridia bacterium]
MQYFEKYVSNSVAGTSVQHTFTVEKGERYTGRVFYKIACGGEYEYSLLFSNITDGTFSDGNISHRNMVCDPWTIHAARVGRCAHEAIGSDFEEPDAARAINERVTDWHDLMFGGYPEKRVAPGEFFCTDGFRMAFEKGEYLCLELTFSGTLLPYMEELQIPAYRLVDGEWVYNKQLPLAGMVGCDRKVKARIGFLGDSITQGIGPAKNSYAHWCALLSEKIGDDYAYWNLGIGCARINDIAEDGAWLYKAKHNDIVFLCAGTNDTWRRYPCDGIIRDWNKTVDYLKAKNITVIAQTVPPFHYGGDPLQTWLTVNEYIKTELAPKVDFVFDEVPLLWRSPEAPSLTKYGAHPNEEGCAMWADALYAALSETDLF